MPIREIVKLGLALAALYAVDRAFKAPPRKKAEGWVEVADNVFAIRDAFGRYLRCEDSDGNIIADKRCAGCGESVFGFKLDNCPTDDEEER